MRLIDSPAVKAAANRYSPEEYKVYLDTIRYEAVFDEVGTNMRLLIRKAGLTQRDVAERLGTSETALSRMLRGSNVKSVKFETIVRFAKAVGVDVLSVFDLSLPANGVETVADKQVEPARLPRPSRHAYNKAEPATLR